MIRQALVTDAPQIARLIIHAMEDLASIICNAQSDNKKTASYASTGGFLVEGRLIILIRH
jgi:hypothetical protein